MLSWNVRQVAQIIGVPYRTLRRWIVNDGLVTLRLHTQPMANERLMLLQEDVEELWAIASLRNDGVSMQRVKRVLVSLAGIRLSDFRAIVVQGHDVIGIPFGEPTFPYRLTDGQIVIKLDSLREILGRTPGKNLGGAWEFMLQAEEYSFA